MCVATISAAVTGITTAISGATAAIGGISGIGTALGLAGTGLSVFSQLQANKFNTETANRQAADATRIATAKEEDHRRQARRIMGAQTADFAQQGIVPTSITALALAEDTARELEFDALKIRAGGQNQALGFSRTAGTLGAERGSIIPSGILSASKQIFDSNQRWAALS